jgi:hypothetical protein
MRGTGLLVSLAVVAGILLVFWAIGRAAGYEVSLGSSLLISVVLTVVLNLVLGAFSRRGSRRTL